eukprot:TRINITY_DN17346_c0_g1_i1.p1 TRINITY_DN17346_c0_g1~~TRINITY_DN17346_c0_g1_i1.p1  ORF type:complete len:101 (+),score=14.60 TRINITY_DN17346_c0_g1_i1:36-338(+)
MQFLEVHPRFDKRWVCHDEGRERRFSLKQSFRARSSLRTSLPQTTETGGTNSASNMSSSQQGVGNLTNRKDSQPRQSSVLQMQPAGEVPCDTFLKSVNVA